MLLNGQNIFAINRMELLRIFVSFIFKTPSHNSTDLLQVVKIKVCYSFRQQVATNIPKINCLLRSGLLQLVIPSLLYTTC